MSQSTAKPSGSLSAIETYGSDDSDQSDDMSPPPPPASTLDMSEASSADVTAEPASESAPESAQVPVEEASEPVAEPTESEPNTSADAQLEKDSENPSSSKTPEKEKPAESDDDNSSSGSSSDDDSSDDEKEEEEEKTVEEAEEQNDDGNHEEEGKEDDVKAEDKSEAEVKESEEDSNAPQDNSEVVEPVEAVANAVTLTTEEPSVDSETSKSVSPEAPATPAESPASPARASSAAASPTGETKTEKSPAVDSPAVASPAVASPAVESPAAASPAIASPAVASTAEDTPESPSPVVADVKPEDVVDEPMDTDEKPEVDEEREDDDDEDDGDDENEDDDDESAQQPVEGSSENPWESPKQTPINGVVQPRTSPPRGKPTRHTNCLDFVLFTVIKDALKHKHSWPFQTPVDADKLEIPTYHEIVTKPMDLRTIERRLRNLYYWSAEDAIKDINQLFTNCYAFNPPEYDVYKMAKTLEKQVLSQLTQLPRTEKPAELADHYRRGMFPASTPSGKTKTPKQRGRKSNRGRKKGSIGRAAMKVDDDDMGDDESKVDSLNFDDEDDITDKDAESRAESVQPESEEQKPSTSAVAAPPSKKRKLENGSDNGVPAKVASPSPATAAAAPPPPPRKNPNTMIDWKSLVPRFHGKQAEWQKFCTKLLTEIHSVRNKSFALVFYQPVDPIKLKIFDYLDIITNPMDLQTIKKKLDFKQYAEPEEFEQDMNLMVDNCCKYNPKGSVVHQNALDMKTFFDSRWKLCPRPGADPIIAETYITQNLVVNTDLVEDEKINNYIAAVKAEEKKCAEKLEELRNMNTDLYKIAVQRRDARLAGNQAPSLEATQIAQLDKLGITIKPTTIVPELISPALSVRSSSRAPVPKIIDDIGPSPIKARKLSKPRQSNASATSVAVYVPPPPSNRGRKPKGAGRPKKIPYSPNASPPHAAAYIPPRNHQKPYVSIYGRTTVTNKDKMELSTKMANITHEFITPVLRIIQISQYNFGKKVSSLRTLCEDEIDFNDVEDDLVLELIDYLEMIKKDRPRAEIARQELEHKAKYYGFVEFDQTSGFMNLKKKKVEPAPPPAGRRVASDSPSPSASRTGAQSSDSDSESDSSDSDSAIQHTANRTAASFKRRLSPPRPASRGSTPAPAASKPAPSKAASKPVAAAKARPTAAAKDVSPSAEAYKKRTLSESSSSDDDDEKSSSDSSDSDSSEPKSKPIAAPPPAKKPMVKKAAPPPKKKPPMTILDELLPETPQKTGPSAPSTSGTVQQMVTPGAISETPKLPQISQEEMKAQQEQEHNEALRRREEARRRRTLEDQPILHQQEVMQAFESQYGDFTY